MYTFYNLVKKYLFISYLQIYFSIVFDILTAFPFLASLILLKPSFTFFNRL